MFRIKPKTNIDTIKERFGKTNREQIRSSRERRQHLENLVTMNVGEPVYVELSGEGAHVDIAKRNSRTGYTDRIVINIPIDTPAQAVTNFDDEAWDLMFQKAELYHEMGHILYTDWPSFEDVMFGDSNGNFGVNENHHWAFKGWWNCLEDACIERILIQRFDIEDELRFKNENLLRQNSPRPTASMAEAIHSALMEYKHPIGWLDRLLDENDSRREFISTQDRELFIDDIHPIIDVLAPRIVNQEDPVIRNRMIYGLFKQIERIFSEAQAPGNADDVNFGFSVDSDQNEGSEGMDPMLGLGEGIGGVDGIDVDGEKIEFEVPENGVDTDVQREYQNQTNQQKQKQSQQQQSNQNNTQQSMEDWARVIDTDYDLDTNLQLEVLDPQANWDQQSYNEAIQLGNTLSSDLEQRLRQQRKSKTQTRQKSGKVDSGRVHKTQSGKTNVFKKQSKPNKKDYSCITIVDRSGSMDDGVDMIPATEQSSGALAHGLEEVGVDVAQMAVHNGSVQLEKDFSESVDDAKDRMFRHENTGGTPISDALAIARVRLENRGGHPFVIVLHDGKPDHRERWRDQLDLCDFPVLGVYILPVESYDEDVVNEAAYFHQLEIREYSESVKGVKNLVKSVMF